MENLNLPVPRHNFNEERVLPNDPLFLRLLTLSASKHRHKIVIRDIKANVERSICALLEDVVKLRGAIRRVLDPQTRQCLHEGKEVFISICAPGGYEFAVGILAILALGASASLVSPAQPVEELKYYIRKTDSVAIICASDALSTCKQLENDIRREKRSDFKCILVEFEKVAVSRSRPRFLVSSNGERDPDSTGIVIFTSGTTGPPKAVAIRRSTISTGAQMLASQLCLEDSDTILHQLPVHHATGVCLSFFPFLQAGACVEFNPGGFNPQWTWDRWRRGDVTHFTGVPTIYMRLMRHWETSISRLSLAEKREYQRAASILKVMFCGTSALPEPVDQFWKRLKDGRSILQRYGSTEAQIAISMPLESDEQVPHGSVGKPSLGVDVKLSEGDSGEVLVKSPFMFSKYLNDPKATRDAHDEQGYYKTGDIARRDGEYYFILGRANVDILKSGGYKISALDIEREILALPYVNEVMVVGVSDDEFGQRVAAVINLRGKDHLQPQEIKLDALRRDLKSKLAGYKLPTLLRVVERELPKSTTGKVVKKTLGPLYFPTNYVDDPDVQVWKSRKVEPKL